MELEKEKVYTTKDDEHNWTFTGYIPDEENPEKKLACFSRIIKEERFIKEDDLKDAFLKSEFYKQPHEITSEKERKSKEREV